MEEKNCSCGCHKIDLVYTCQWDCCTLKGYTYISENGDLDDDKFELAKIEADLIKKQAQRYMKKEARRMEKKSRKRTRILEKRL